MLFYLFLPLNEEIEIIPTDRFGIKILVAARMDQENYVINLHCRGFISTRPGSKWATT